MPTAITLLTFHLNLFHLTLDINLPHHLPTTTTRITFMQHPRHITSPFTMLAYLPPSKTVHTWPTSIESRQWDRHLCSKITAFRFGSFLYFPQTLFAKQVIGVSFGHIYKRLVCSFNFEKFLLYILVTSIPIRMILDG